MKAFLTIAALCVLGLATSLAVVGQEQQQPVPPGVSEANWIPIGDKVGFVITPAVANHDPTVLAGYFLAWHGNAWKRIDNEGGFRFQPLKK